MEKERESSFSGFKKKYSKDFTTFPHHLWRHLHQLNGSEVFVLSFLIRMTLGFQKTSDEISISQIVDGNTDENRGTGLSKSTIIGCLKSLEDKGFITIKKKSHRTNYISLKLEDEKEDREIVEKKSINPDVLRLIEMFRPISGHLVDGYSTNKRQIDSMVRIVEAHGLTSIEQMMTVLPELVNIQYCPYITSPVELERKFPKLLIFVKQKQDEKKSKGIRFSI